MKSLMLLVFCFFIGLQDISAQTKKEHLPVFDFTKDYPQKKLRLQDIANIEYVPLETAADVLLGGSSVLSAITDKYILVHEVQLGAVFVLVRKPGSLYSQSSLS